MQTVSKEKCIRGWEKGRPETICGRGSTLESARNVMARLRTLLDLHAFKRVLDVGCGDWNWMRFVDLSGLLYHGLDQALPFVLTTNVWAAERPPSVSVFHEGSFLTMDMQQIPEADVILCRDVLIHFNNADALAFVKRAAQRSPYLLATSDSEVLNVDGHRSGNRSHHPINMEAAPFNLTMEDRIEDPTKTRVLGLFDIARFNPSRGGKA